MRVYLSALSVHRAEQRANIVFTHTHGFAMQIIWYYCTYSAYRRGSSVTGTASNPSFLPCHPLAEYLFARYTHRLYCTDGVVSKRILLLLLFHRESLYYLQRFPVASIARKMHSRSTVAFCSRARRLRRRLFFFFSFFFFFFLSPPNDSPTDGRDYWNEVYLD